MTHAACRLLWLTVLERAFSDATSDSDTLETRRERPIADRWIRGCGKDFREVCLLAGMDADFLSEAYKAGRINPEVLHSRKAEAAQ